MWDVCPVPGPGRLGLNKDHLDKQEEYEENIPWPLGVCPALRQTKRENDAYLSVLPKGLRLRFRGYILSGLLV